MREDQSSLRYLQNAHQLQTLHIKYNKIMQLIHIDEQEFESIKGDLEKSNSVLYYNCHFLTSTNGRLNVVVKNEISNKELQEVDRILNAIPIHGLHEQNNRKISRKPSQEQSRMESCTKEQNKNTENNFATVK